MEPSLIALLVASIGLATGVAGSIVLPPGLAYPHLVPYKLAYTNEHSPELLAQALGLTVEQALAAAAAQAQSVEPVIGVSLQDINSQSSTLEQQPQEAPSNQPAVVSSPGVVASPAAPTLPAIPQPSIAIEQAPAAAPESPLPALLSPKAPLPESALLVGETLLPSSPGVPLAETAVLVADALSPAPAAAVSSELPVVVAAEASKSVGGANVNVNIHVNLNGDGTGSVYNATSAADIKSPIEVEHKRH